MRILVTIALLGFTGCECGPGPAVGDDAGGSDAGTNDAGADDAGFDAGSQPDASVSCTSACGANATCQVSMGVAQCVCQAGFSGDGLTCADVDECQAGTAACASGDTCHNVPGSYFCGCGPGQTWNGTACEQAGLRRIGAGSDHLCRIDSQGELRCWGWNQGGQLGDGTQQRRNVMTPVVGGHVWKSVSVGRERTCAIDTGGRAWCWGFISGLVSGSVAQTSQPLQMGTETDWEQLSVGESHVCGLRTGGGLFCFGLNGQGQLGSATPLNAPADAPLQVEPGTAWGVVTVGASYTCAVKRDGSLWCWGNNLYGNLGDGTTTTQKTPTQVGMDTDWRTVDASAFFSTCGIRLDGTLWCWGANMYGQAAGTGQMVTTPAQRMGASGWRSVDPGTLTTCGTLYSGAVSCWGRPIGAQDAQPGLSRVIDVATAEPGAVGWPIPNFVCALTEDESTWCWGQNNNGELAQGNFANKSAPERVGQATWAQAEPGTAYTCGLRTGGTLWCWGGSNAIDGPLLAIGQPGPVQSPVPLEADGGWRGLATGATSFCALKRDDSLWCAGDEFSSTAMAQVGTDTNWTSIDLGRAFYLSSWMPAAGLRDDQSLWTFNTARPPVATQLGTDLDWVEVAMSRTHACGRRGGAIWCWIQSSTPQQVGTATDYTLVRSASAFTTLSGQVPARSYGIRTDNTLWQWTMSTATPTALTQIGQGIAWQTFDVGPGQLCGVATDNSLWCWGATNLPLAVETGTIASVTSPVRVGTDNDWVGVKVGSAHVTALKTDGSLWSWGYGETGQLGHGDAWRLMPVRTR